LTKPFQSIRDLVSKVGSLFGGGGAREGGGDATEERAPRGAPGAGGHDAARAGALTPEGARGADPAASFADLSADDELIEARPADAFGASAGAAGFPPRAESHRGFAEVREPEFHTPQPEANGSVAPASFGAAGVDVFGRRRQDRETSRTEEVLTEQTEEREMSETTSSQPSFDARAAGAVAADDSLLDLAEVDEPATAAADDDDDFVLDLDDEPTPQYAAASHAAVALDEPAFEAAPAAPAWADAPSAFAEAAHGEQPRAFVEASVAEVTPPPGEKSRGEEFRFGEQPQAAESHAPAAVAEAAGEPWRDVVMQDGPQGFAFGSEAQPSGGAPGGFVEPEVVPADEPVPAVVEGEYTDGSVEGDVPKAPAPEVTAAAAAPAPQEPTAAGFAVGEARAGLDESPGAGRLLPEDVEAIARRVVELMSDRAVREIAWEVVPELAELVIRQRLDEEKNNSRQ
jgi:hypothetical protein